MNQPYLLQQIRFNLGPGQLALVGEFDINVFPKAGTVVVTESAGITERFENGVRLEDLLFDTDFFSGGAR